MPSLLFRGPASGPGCPRRREKYGLEPTGDASGLSGRILASGIGALIIGILVMFIRPVYGAPFIVGGIAAIGRALQKKR